MDTTKTAYIIILLSVGILFPHVKASERPKSDYTILVESKGHTRVKKAYSISLKLSDTVNNNVDSIPIIVSRMDSSNMFLISVLLKPDSSDLLSALISPNDILPENTLLTNQMGEVNVILNPFHYPGNYNFRVLLKTNDQIVSESIHGINVKAKDWVFKLIIGLIGGLSLFLYGMHLLSNGLQNSAGHKMRLILEKLTSNRFFAVGIGAIVTAVIQSSSATNVMLVSFVDSKLMRFRQTIGVILGAAIGTTITAQIIAFKITDYALVFVSIGLILFLVSKKERLTEIGLSVLGFGILFYGMHIMSDSMYPLRTYQPFINIISTLENPAYGILVGTLFTALIQSSSAFIGILIVLSMQGLLSFNASLSLIIGANVGTAITAIIASINTSREAQQVAFAHTLIKLVGAGIVLSFLPLFSKSVLLVNSSADLAVTPRVIANAHTLFNVILLVLFLPITNKVANLTMWLFPAKEEPIRSFKVTYINPSLLATPDIALNAARKEFILMMQEVKAMFGKIIIPFETRDNSCLIEIIEMEERVNLWRDELVDYLVVLSRGERSKVHIEEGFILLNAVKEFEQIADIISNQLVSKAETWCNSKFKFSKQGLQELQEYHCNTLGILQKSIKVYKDFNPKKAQKLKDRYSEYREEYFELERLHYKRLKKNIDSTVSSSKTHLELITLFRVVSSHATNTARTIITRNIKTKKNDRSKSSNNGKLEKRTKQ